MKQSLIKNMPFILVLVFTWSCTPAQKQESNEEPAEDSAEQTEYTYKGEKLRVGVVGLVHTHVHWILGREDLGDIEIVGIAEPNRELAQRYSEMHGFSMDIVFDTIDEMVEATNPEAVTAFNKISEHLDVVEYCAPRGIHVMVEKPLAMNLEHAVKMRSLAEEHEIQLLTNYETSWYGSTTAAYDLLNKQGKIGDLRKMVFNTGHPGPKEIGVNIEFLEWLIDPQYNGGGALTDFGCYGANIATWFTKGTAPLSVSCITQQIKPDIYPLVEDEATILVEYPESQVIIQASWNWAYNRKDMTVYGKSGVIRCLNGTDMEFMESEEAGFADLEADPLPFGEHDPFAYLTNVVKNDLEVEPWSVSSLENNMMVMQILEAAKISAETGKTVIWEDFVQNSN